MSAHVDYPVRVEARLDPEMSRWVWLVKWFLAIPHYIVLAFLFVAFSIVSIAAFFAILFTGRYPRGIFEFNVGVLRWSWRVSYYSYGALGTDKYPPFTLKEVEDYPAKFEVAYPDHLSRGLVLIKWWLLALPHYLIVAILGGATWFAWRSDDWQAAGPGLIGLLVFISGVALLFTGAYPKPLFDLILGLNRWVLRVAAYASLMTDRYPPFRLDMGGSEGGGTLAVSPDATASPGGAAVRGWGPGSILALIVGVVLSFIAVGVGAAGGVGLWADQTQRDAAGFISTDTETFSTTAHAIVSESIDIEVEGAESYFPNDLLGEARMRVTATDGNTPVFVGLADSDAAARYLNGVAYAVTDDFHGDIESIRSGASHPMPPAEAGIWTASVEGTGTQTLIWEVAEGDWTLVAMNADGSEAVSIRADAGLEVPALSGISIGLIVAGGILMLIAGGIVVAATTRAHGRKS
ncbi:MAG TPA: DUF4389 domain-containing protein [Actinomycetota bacterium]|nr:DUF4389 domain-containing protein [Actinomycetota bacterium]